MRHPLSRLVVLAMVTLVAGALTPANAVAASKSDAVRTSSIGVNGFSASATIGGYPVWADFSNPAAGGQDFTIIDEVNRLIAATPSGASIKAAIHSLNIDSVSQSLVDAESRGVNVWVVIDGKNTNSTDPAVTIAKQLEHHKFCNRSSGGRSCISTSADGDMHAKMLTFTETTDPNGVARNDVVWFSSANISHASGSGAKNNAITVYGDAALTAGLNANFDDMWNERHYAGNDYYDSASGRGYYHAGAANVYASPEGAGQTDTIVTRLNDLTPDGNCVLRIGMAAVTGGRPQLVSLMQRFEANGCDVTMAVGTNSAGDIAMSKGPYDDLLAAGVGLRRTEQVHDKFFIATGNYGGDHQYRVYTGSQNWTQDALGENDEIFVKMAPEQPSSHPLYDAYETHWRSAWDAGVTCTTSNFPCR